MKHPLEKMDFIVFSKYLRKKFEYIKKSEYIIILYRTELGFSCTFRLDFIGDTHYSSLAAHCLAMNRRILIINARTASSQKHSYY